MSWCHHMDVLWDILCAVAIIPAHNGYQQTKDHLWHYSKRKHVHEYPHKTIHITLLWKTAIDVLVCCSEFNYVVVSKWFLGHIDRSYTYITRLFNIQNETCTTIIKIVCLYQNFVVVLQSYLCIEDPKGTLAGMYLAVVQFTYPRMHLLNIPQCSIQNGNVHIYILNKALWDMEQVHLELMNSVNSNSSYDPTYTVSNVFENTIKMLSSL